MATASAVLLLIGAVLMIIGAAVIILTGDFNAVISNFGLFRESIASSSDIIVSIATALAALFIIFNMIKIAYDLFSDEQSGGLGGVSVKQILVPLVLLFILQGYGLVIKALDDTCKGVTESLINKNTQANIAKSMQLSKIQSSNSLRYTGDEDEAIKNLIDSYAKRPGIEHGGYEVNELLKEYAKYNTDDGKLGFGERISLTRKFRSALNKIRNLTQNAERNKQTDDEITRESFWQKAAMSVYAIIQCYLEIILCLMVLLGPFTLAFSILPPWKHSFITFIGKYIEISFSKVVASFILWITATISGTIATKALDSAEVAKMELTNMIINGDITGIEAFQLSNAHYCNVIIWLAGMVALFAVPAISSNILNLAAPNMSGSEKAGGIAGSMTKSAGGLGSKGASSLPKKGPKE